MTNETAKYRKAVKKQLLCCGNVRKRLLEKLDTLLASYTEENGAVTAEDLILAFGPPEETARTLMAEVTPQEHTLYRRRKVAIRILSGILSAFILLFTVYIYFIKSIPVEYHNEAVVDGVETSTSSSAGTEGLQ